MRIGVIIKEFNSLRDFELRIIEKIFNDPSLDLALVVRASDQHKLKNNNLNQRLRNNYVFGSLLLRWQLNGEKRFFKSKQLQNKEEILNLLYEIPTIEVYTATNGFVEMFSDEDSDKVNSNELDILLTLGSGDVGGKIMSSAKNGIWSFSFGDKAVKRQSPLAFWEIVLKEPVIGVSLYQLTTDLDQKLIIDKGFYNRHWSILKSRRNILDQCIAILFKNIRKLQNNEMTTIKSTVSNTSLSMPPTIIYVLKYLVRFYGMAGKRLYEGVMASVFGKKHQCWTLFIGQGNFMEASLHKLKPIKLPKDEFWADPFLYKYQQTDYIFFENYSYSHKKGKISCGRVDNDKLVDVVDVLERDYHLSYPFIFEEDGSLFMIPESSGNKKVEILKCINFPNKWESYSTAFEGESIVDTTYYKDKDKQRWLFLSKGYANYRNSELYIYKIDSLKMDSIQEHRQNPVLIDSRIARGAGGIFKYGNQLIRPSQNNSNGTYGYGLNINEIEKLSLTEYKEKRLTSILPDFKKNLASVHHLSQGKSKFVIDGAFTSN